MELDTTYSCPGNLVSDFHSQNASTLFNVHHGRFHFKKKEMVSLNPEAEEGGKTVVGGVNPKHFKRNHTYVPVTGRNLINGTPVLAEQDKNSPHRAGRSIASALVDDHPNNNVTFPNIDKRVTALSRIPFLTSSSLLTPASTGIADSRLGAIYILGFTFRAEKADQQSRS
ncbi:hypothetical protein DKX38_019179 [Salix brachista]|uniref:Uncharacterized protein n=1 Tax=Salix brachista TaxID=2182728 RepID=A0A5N5KFL2_9ROSI|nr:hypothetical protein DKX38_019179 [Salix brachista]